MARLRIDALNKSYGETKVLVDVSLRIDDGEFVVLVGPSGCGKSTLLRMLAGLENISAGDIMIGPAVLKSWGLHMVDVNIVEGDLTDLVERQGKAWLAAH